MQVCRRCMCVRSLRTELVGARGRTETAMGALATDLWLVRVASKSTIAPREEGDGAWVIMGVVAVDVTAGCRLPR